MKVTKFGGSSLASAPQLKKVLNIIKDDPERRFVVVSAPGKRNTEDTKVTDALIRYYKEFTSDKDVTQTQQWIIERYRAITEELGLKDSIIQEIAENIYDLTNLPKKGNPFTYDAFLAAGENNNAKLIAAYFNQNGLEAKYIHPKEAGITVTAEPSNARILPSSYDKIEELKDASEVIVIPGFFGVTQDGDICTFSRGGSDITGSIIAAGVKADLYENFTDVNGIFAAHPGIIKHPHSIPELTYKEMRELAYAGFSVLHDEALVPIKEQEILKQLTQKLEVDTAEIEHDLSIIMIVGEKMKSQVGVTATAAKALSENEINIQMISQGSSEVSIMFVVSKDQEEKAIKALYNAFFPNN